MKHEIHLTVGGSSWESLKSVFFRTTRNSHYGAISGPRCSPKTAIYGSRNGKNVATIILGPETGQMAQFLSPEIVWKLQFLGREMVKLVQQLFWVQKLTKWCNFWAQKLTIWARETLWLLVRCVKHQLPFHTKGRHQKNKTAKVGTLSEPPRPPLVRLGRLSMWLFLSLFWTN